MDEFWSTLFDGLTHLRSPETAAYFSMISNNLSNEFSVSMQQFGEKLQVFGEFLAVFLQKVLEVLMAMSAEA